MGFKKKIILYLCLVIGGIIGGIYVGYTLAFDDIKYLAIAFPLLFTGGVILDQIYEREFTKD